MTPLFVSDLDGTLLDAAGQLSRASREGLRQLLDRGVAFTIATARSVYSVRERFDLPVALPIVCANGTFVDDLATARHLHIADMERQAGLRSWRQMSEHGLDPIFTTTSAEHGDRMFFLREHGEATAEFLEDRRLHGDPRVRVVDTAEAEAVLGTERITGLVAIDRPERVGPLANVIATQAAVSVDLNEDYYQRGYQWLTVHSATATKGHGVGLLREHYAPAADRLVVFGDQPNDLPMFAVADHAVAVANAHPDVLAAADEVIGAHHDDAVITWLLAHLYGGDEA